MIIKPDKVCRRSQHILTTLLSIGGLISNLFAYCFILFQCKSSVQNFCCCTICLICPISLGTKDYSGQCLQVLLALIVTETSIFRFSVPQRICKLLRYRRRPLYQPRGRLWRGGSSHLQAVLSPLRPSG